MNPPPVIDIENLTKYYGKVKGIQNVSLRIEKGEIFGFIGPNGAGKSTTIRILMNLIFPSGGRAEIMGMDVISRTRDIKKITGYIPADANAYASMDVGEFLNYCGRFYKIPDLDGRIRTLSGLMELDLKRKVEDLSSGNRKKVSIVQSLIHSPDLLIMDEPTTGLDPLMKSAFFELLNKENQRGMTIFFSSHILSEVQLLCKRVAIIKEGNIIQLEDIDSLRKKQLKKVFIEFNTGPNVEDFNVPGVVNMTSGPENVLTFLYSGDIGKIINILSGKGINNLIIEEPSLDEIFMHYYRI
jgi:ABC-2 type transport system ATP-binding protein